MKKFIIAALFLVLCGISSGQSPNAQGATARIDASLLQLRSERGQSNGYVPLGAYVAPLSGTPVVDPRYLFPGFAAAADNTIWVKSGSDLVPLGGVVVSGGNITVNNVFTGELTSGIYGVKISSGSYPLFLRGGSGNRVMVDYNQTIGGADSLRSSYLWFINSSGGFKLAGGEFGGSIDLNSSAISEAATIAGAGMSANFATPTVTSLSGNLTLAAPATYGVVVPSTASGSNVTFALNPTSADTLYGRKDQTNTWGSVQTFSAAPVVPDDSFTIAKVAALQAALNATLKKDGSNSATANLSMGGYKLTNVGTPTSSTDAVTLGYLTSNYSTGAISSITAAGGTPLTINTVSGATTITQVSASASVNGYLSSSDFTRFTNASSADPWANGELIIGSTVTGKGVKGTLTAGTGIGITNGAGTITISFSPSGIAGARPSSLLNSSVTQTNIATTTPTSMYSYTVPANSLVAGDVVKVRTTGNFILEGAQTISVTFVVGGTTVVTLSLPGSGFTPSTSEVPYVLEISMAVRTAGVSGTAVYSASLQTPTSTILASTGSTTLVTTSDRTLSVTMEISAIAGTNHVSVENGTTRLN